MTRVYKVFNPTFGNNASYFVNLLFGQYNLSSFN